MTRKYHDPSTLPRTKEEAKSLGLKAYFTGEPCKNGHVAIRQVLNGQCRGCSDANKVAWIASNPDRQKRYGRSHYEANRQDYIDRASAWRRANPEAAKASGKRTKARPGGALKRLEDERRRRKENPEPSRVRVRNRRARLRQVVGAHSAQDIAEIFKLQHGRCGYCRVKISPKTWEVYHIRPVAKGGANDRRNLQLLCLPCNRTKSAKDPLDFAREKELLL